MYVLKVFLWDDDMWVVPLYFECCSIGKWLGEYDVVSSDTMQNDRMVISKR